MAEAAAATDDVDATVKACADRLGLSLGNLTSYLLARTAVLACIASLHAAGDARLAIEGNGLRLRLKPPRL